jgi:hypothetical protein
MMIATSGAEATNKATKKKVRTANFKFKLRITRDCAYLSLMNRIATTVSSWRGRLLFNKPALNKRNIVLAHVRARWPGSWPYSARLYY